MNGKIVFLVETAEKINNSMSRRIARIPVWGVLLLIVSGGILLRLGALYFNQPIPTRDAIYYSDLIEEWYRSGSFDLASERFVLNRTAIPPFLFYIGQLFMHCGLSAYSSGIIVNMFFGSVLPIVLFGCALLLWPNNYYRAYIVAILTAIQPTLIDFSVDVLREISYLFWVACAFYFWLKMYQQRQYWSAVLLGVMIALATLCRYEAFEIFPILLLTLILGCWVRHFAWKQGFMMGIMSAVGVLLGYGTFFIISKVSPSYIFAWVNKVFLYMGRM